MKRAFFAFFSLLTFSAYIAPAASGQSADRIIGRYKKAIGGSAASRIKSTIMTGSIKTGDGAEGRFSYQATSPDRLRIDIDAGPLKLSECYNGKSAWARDSRGLRTLLGQEVKSVRLQALLANSRLRNLSRNRVFAQAVASTSVEGRSANAVEFVMNDARAKLFFDSASYLLVKQERELAEGVEEVFFDEYRKVDGVMEPFAIRIKRGTSNLVVAIDKVEHNRAVDETAYRYPQIDGSRSLPDIEALLKAVTANQEKLEELRDHYTFRQTETERKLDGDGRVKETEIRAYEVTPVAGRFVRRLVSVNGKDLSASEREKEDRRVMKEVEEAMKRREKQQSREQSKRDRGEADSGDDDVTISSFLRISEITSVRREMFRGEEVIAFDFEPRKGFKPRNRIENIVSKLAGTIWVDEQAREIARLEARLTDSFKLGGGLLASISPSTAFVFEQEKVEDELWLPSYAEANISARLLLFAKFRRSITTRYTDYKKYKIESDYRLNKPKAGEKQ